MDEALLEEVAIRLATACSRSAVPAETLDLLQDAFVTCKLIRLSFGLQNKVMVSITVDLQGSGATHASYVPIQPSAAAAAVLQNQPIVVVREANVRSPLWDQEDLYQREGCNSMSVVSMPFYWPPRPGTLYEDQPLPVPQNTAHQPTFAALTVAGSRNITNAEMGRLNELALRTGRHVREHISMLLASLEGAGLLPTEAEAQEELEDIYATPETLHERAVRNLAAKMAAAAIVVALAAAEVAEAAAAEAAAAAEVAEAAAAEAAAAAASADAPTSSEDGH